ncbi:hypothetical protein B0H63DRAFT_503291 [Podospora didyma]|uniref:FAD-binding PCMH-type domain-containing protein n=1 Tax=Podospora didyma TaxID=330526 RepID=A0AAE0N9Q3_9PEZI|nr:hypothetical protein B0H63DRAFT_503291 [Podospora didyma]
MTNTASTLASACCAALFSLLGGNKVFLPGSAGYAASLGSYFSPQAASVLLLCIVAPQTVHDVSAAVRSMTAGSGGGGGGDHHHAGGSSSNRSLTVDLRALNAINLNQDRSIVSVGVGATWDAVYRKLDPPRLSAVGGRAAGAGVGGLTLGGGISHLGPRFGFTYDTFTNFEVELADGSVVQVNGRDNPDLLWALRGGSNNFGVVTRVDLKAVDQGNFWGGVMLSPIETASQQISEFVKINSATQYDEYAALIMSFGKPVVNPPVFQNLTKLPQFSSTLRVTNHTDLVVETRALQRDGMRQASAVLAIKSTPAALSAAFAAWNASLPAVQNITGLIWALVLEPLPPQIYARHAAGTKGDALVVTLLSMTWTLASDDAAVDREAKALLAKIRAEATRLGAYHPFLYLNYAAPWQDPVASYGWDNVRRLRAV